MYYFVKIKEKGHGAFAGILTGFFIANSEAGASRQAKKFYAMELNTSERNIEVVEVRQSLVAA